MSAHSTVFWHLVENCKLSLRCRNFQYYHATNKHGNKHSNKQRNSFSTYTGKPEMPVKTLTNKQTNKQKHYKTNQPSSRPTARLTERCWKSHARIMLVATLGKIPRFLFLLLPRSSSSSAVPSPDPTLLSNPSPATQDVRDWWANYRREWSMRWANQNAVSGLVSNEETESDQVSKSQHGDWWVKKKKEKKKDSLIRWANQTKHNQWTGKQRKGIVWLVSGSKRDEWTGEL